MRPHVLIGNARAAPIELFGFDDAGNDGGCAEERRAGGVGDVFNDVGYAVQVSIHAGYYTAIACDVNGRQWIIKRFQLINLAIERGGFGGIITKNNPVV